MVGAPGYFYDKSVLVITPPPLGCTDAGKDTDANRRINDKTIQAAKEVFDFFEYECVLSKENEKLNTNTIVPETAKKKVLINFASPGVDRFDKDQCLSCTQKQDVVVSSSSEEQRKIDESRREEFYSRLNGSIALDRAVCFRAISFDAIILLVPQTEGG